jgi:bifunctional ADP-heptose synthase (sugar kinase/adenylyltransferase)
VNCSNKELDTRQKVLSPDEVAAALDKTDKLTVFVGHFDPLTVEHARQLIKLRRSNGLTVVIVTDPPEPILPQRARAELAAALHTVDYVIAASHNTSAEIIARLQPDKVIQDEGADLRRTQQLIAHVRGRQIAKEA